MRKKDVWQKISEIPYKHKRIHEDTDQLHLYVNDVKVTFFNYPYRVDYPTNLDNIIRMPILLSLAAMKSFALGRKAKWKDYVDMYFLLKNYFSIQEISQEAITLYEGHYSEKLFREQLAFHKNIDYSEQVEFMTGFEEKEETIKAFLIEKSLKW